MNSTPVGQETATRLQARQMLPSGHRAMQAVPVQQLTVIMATAYPGLQRTYPVSPAIRQYRSKDLKLHSPSLPGRESETIFPSVKELYVPDTDKQEPKSFNAELRRYREKTKEQNMLCLSLCASAPL